MHFAHVLKVSMARELIIPVQVCCVMPEQQFLCTLDVAEHSTIAQVIRMSGIALPGTDIQQLKVGIYGKIRTPDTVVRAHDRIEIYRPLQADPMEARRRRIVKQAG